MKRTALICVLLGTVIGIALFSSFGSISVCSICACHSHSMELQFPLVPVTYWRYQSTEPTPLSELADALSLVETHDHDWRFIHGSGNGITCALGTGRELDRNVRSFRVVAFIADTNRYRGKQESLLWFQRALHQKESGAVSDWLLMTEYPEKGFESAASYTTWRKSADRKWPEVVTLNNRWGLPYARSASGI